MGYRVEYPQASGANRGKKPGSRVAALTALGLLLFAIGVTLFWPRGAQALRELLLPGDAAITASAMEELAVQLKGGTTLHAALLQFCRAILQGARSYAT